MNAQRRESESGSVSLRMPRWRRWETVVPEPKIGIPWRPFSPFVVNALLPSRRLECGSCGGDYSRARLTGRFALPIISPGLFIEGEADGFWFEGNDFTTWPTNNYDLYPPGVNPRTPQYQLIWKVPDDPSPEICGIQVATRNDVTTVNMLGNRVSMRAYDFGKIEDAPGTGTGNFEVLPPAHPQLLTSMATPSRM